MKKGLLVSILAVTLLFSGCGAKKAVDNTKPNVGVKPASSVVKVERPNFTRETYPKIDGSTATIPLSQAVASNLLGMSKADSAKFIKHNKTDEAYHNLINGKADIIFVTEPSQDELKIAKDANVELEVVPVVKEGFVFLVNSNNPANNLTTKQIQDIYQGKIKNWKDVGGPDKEIIAYQRDKNSGSQTLMEQKVMKGLKLMEQPKTVVSGMDGLIESVASYDNSDTAIGYSVFYYAKTMYVKDSIKLISVDGVAPNNTSISSGKYPFTTAYYAVIRKSDPADSASRKLLNWMLGAEGQKVADNAGYVPLNVR